MSEEIKAYLRLEAKIAAAFNFFINGMIAALIYHQVDLVPMDSLGIVIDITITCLFIFIITAPFVRASLRRTKTEGILESDNLLISRLSCLFRYHILFDLFMGLAVAAILSTLVAPIFVLAGVKAIPFSEYILFKSISCGLIGGVVTLTDLYLGMVKVDIMRKTIN